MLVGELGRIKMASMLYFGCYLLNSAAICIFIKLFFFLKRMKHPLLEIFVLIWMPDVFPFVLTVGVV